MPNRDEEAAKLTTNFEILEGTYFDERIDIGNGLYGLTSKTFPDIGWNYLYSEVSAFDVDIQVETTVCSAYPHLKPYLVFLPSQRPTRKKRLLPSLGNFSVWMSCRKSDLRPRSHTFLRSTFAPQDTKIVNEAVACFEAAYCNHSPTDIGYNALDESYPRGFRKMLIQGKNCFLVTRHADSDLAALASVAFHPNGRSAGIYNVAVSPRYRGDGVGAAVSSDAAALAFEHGATECILQTESDTPVQTLYEKIGFKVDFHLQHTEI